MYDNNFFCRGVGEGTELRPSVHGRRDGRHCRRCLRQDGSVEPYHHAGRRVRSTHCPSLQRHRVEPEGQAAEHASRAHPHGMHCIWYTIHTYFTYIQEMYTTHASSPDRCIITNYFRNMDALCIQTYIHT